MIHFENRDCMDAMKEFPDKFFDLAIVDPPPERWHTLTQHWHTFLVHLCYNTTVKKCREARGIASFFFVPP